MPTPTFEFRRNDYGWETSRRIPGQGTQYIEIGSNEACSPKFSLWAEDAVRQCAAWSKAARRLVGHEMLHDYYRDELGYGRNRVERIELDAKGKLFRLVFTFRRSYAAVTVNFVDGTPTEWDSTG